ncbi:FAD/NAD(P)-binding domain-containing protein [Pholiota conissans]|uniref:FAD/NAD(P)-binding domain-containing protein n=1 Tax=Pholiota conissans TaxID=109636 RepID=A0A9P5Z4K5_9AGAR|nr:FAD/NAD(P)-binding domain-containing protein [Pholiota conissans]
MNRQPVKKRVVVVGGGGAGASIVRGLVKVLDPSKHELILITSRPQYAHLPAALRVLVDEDTPINTLFMPYDTIFDHFPAKLVIGCISSIDENKSLQGGRLILKTGEQIVYDILAVATGSRWDGCLSFPSEQDLYEEHIRIWRNKFAKAHDIVIVGGGAVGIEAAGEIKDVYPDKSVTIVHNENYLMNDIYPRKFRMDLERRLRLRGINVIVDDAVEGQPRVDGRMPLKTRNGASLRCDLLIAARGTTPNTSLFNFILPTPLGSNGYVQVGSTLQVRGHPSIFAAGDIINVPEVKQLVKTTAHAAVVVANIVSYLRNEQPKKVWKPGKEMIIVSNGRNGGGAYLGVLWGLKFGDMFSKLINSRDLFVEHARKNLGLPVHSN